MEKPVLIIDSAEHKMLSNLCKDKNKAKKIEEIISEESLTKEDGYRAAHILFEMRYVAETDDEKTTGETLVQVTETGYSVFQKANMAVEKKSAGGFEFKEIITAIFPGGRGMDPGRYDNEDTRRRNKIRILMIVIALIIILIFQVVMHSRKI